MSIILSMHNSAATIVAALTSIERQDFRDWEMIVVDDGSTDDSAAHVRRFADARIRFMADGRRMGLGARLNQAVDAARGRLVARMDADDIAYPERLRLQRDFLESHPEVDLLGSGMLVFRDDGSGVGRFPVRCRHDDICARPYAGFRLAHPTWMGRIEWFRRWRYDPRCLKAQDQDLLLRSYRDSVFAALPEPLLGYRQDRPSIHKSFQGRLTFARSVWRQAGLHGERAVGMLAVGEQLAKFAYDAIAIGTGANRSLLRHRALPLSEAELARWRRVWLSCTGKEDLC